MNVSILDGVAAMHKLSNLLRVFLVCLMLACFPTLAKAETGVDVIVVIDQSGSMWGHAGFNGTPNDPESARIMAPQVVGSTLSSSIAGRVGKHNLSIIEYATTTHNSVPETSLVYDPNNPRRNFDAITALAPQIGNLNTLGDPNGSAAKVDEFLTNTPAALTAASVSAAKLYQQDGEPQRKRLVILITDGRPCVRNCGSAAGLTRAFSDIERHVTNLQASDFNFYVIGLNDRNNLNGGYWQSGDGRRWGQIAGSSNTFFVKSPEEMHGAITKIISDANATASQNIIGNRFEVPPYQRRLSVNSFFLKASSSDPELVLPDGSQVKPAIVPDFSKTDSGAYVFDVASPITGIYEITTSGLGNNPVSNFSTHGPLPVLINTPATTSIGVTSPVTIGLKRDATDPVIVPLQDWPYSSAEAVITAPDGTSVSVVPNIDNTAGLLSFDWVPKITGKHNLGLRVLSQRPNGADVSILEPGTLDIEIDVADVPPIYLEPVSPSKLRKASILPWASSFSTEFKFVNDDGSDAKLTDVLTSSNGFIDAAVLDQSGVELTGLPPITVDVADDKIRLTIPASINALVGEGWARRKNAYFKIEPNTNALAGDVIFGGLRLKDEAAVLSVPGVSNSVGPVSLRLPLWLLIVMGLCLIGLLGILALLCLRFSYSFLQIKREDSKRGGKVEFQILRVGGNPSGPAIPVRVDLTGRSSVKLNKKYQLRINGQKSQIEKLLIKRSPQGNSQRAKAVIKYKIENGSKKMEEVIIRSENAPLMLKGVKDEFGAQLRLIVKKRN